MSILHVSNQSIPSAEAELIKRYQAIKAGFYNNGNLTMVQTVAIQFLE